MYCARASGVALLGYGLGLGETLGLISSLVLRG